MPAQTATSSSRACAQAPHAAVGRRLAHTVVAAALSLGALAGSAHAAFLYTFQFDALQPGPRNPGASAATISFVSDDIAVFGSTLSYDSGSLNGCMPFEITYSAGFEGFGTGANNVLSCGDFLGPQVDGMLFNPDIVPLTVGSYTSTGGAGRVFAAENTQTFFTNGRLTIATLGAAVVPEPATLGLVGVSLAALWGVRRRRVPIAT